MHARAAIYAAPSGLLSMIQTFCRFALVMVAVGALSIAVSRASAQNAAAMPGSTRAEEQAVLATVQRLYKAEDSDFRLRPGSAAVDRGLVLPTITDGFTGPAPDLGALEVGQAVPVYGPRPR